MIKAIWQCMFTPRLIKLYGNGPVERLYEPNSLENLGDRVLQSLYFMWKLGIYSTPIIVGFLYRKGYLEAEGCVTLTKFATLIGGILVVSYVIRSIGRATNPMYQRFIRTLNEATQQEQLTPARKQQLAMYDFEFHAWPIEFRWSEIERDEIRDRLFITAPQTHRNFLELGATLPCHILGYLAVHTFGIRLVYPGSISLLQHVLSQGLLQGRSKLIEVNGGVRYKLEARDGNAIDAMFVDRRQSGNAGNTLVICCEGNAGFYEIGIMGTVIATGYSVLGWNHPGFGGSTGTPYPSQELNAMDIVMQFAITKLGYRVENIVLFGWSIGGYASSWAAMNYPNIKGIILDASFDDIIPLALNQMPAWTESIVRLAIREYINLNNFEQLSNYPGPILLIRRTEDEVICTTAGDITTNRGNNLLMKLLKYRYPYIVGDTQTAIVANYLALTNSTSQDQFALRYKVDNDECNSYFESAIIDNLRAYPLRLGEDLSNDVRTRLAIFLVRKYMKDYKATHCSVLPSDMFQMPWEITAENDFVFP